MLRQSSGPGIAQRFSSGLADLDTLLGGGLVRGGILLFSGDPGIGKSTICLQIAAAVKQAGHTVLYVSGEESMDQVASRAQRLGGDAEDVMFLGETNLDSIEAAIDELQPTLLITDSIQTLHDPESSGQVGQVSQLRGAGARLQRIAKGRNISTIVIGHVTKDGSLAGPKVLEHIVDAIAHFTHAGDGEHRIVRTYKNRFGAVGELAVFRMTELGLEPVTDPSRLFLADRSPDVAGSAVTVILEGTRAVCVEIQALVTPSGYGTPQRVALGYSRTRLSVLVALLEKRAGIAMSTMDVFINVVGGLEINDPAVDAAVLAAMASSVLDVALPASSCFFGEVGLGGELRRAGSLERRVLEAARVGFTNAVVPSSQSSLLRSALTLTGVRLLPDLLEQALPWKPKARLSASVSSSTNTSRRAGAKGTPQNRGKATPSEAEMVSDEDLDQATDAD